MTTVVSGPREKSESRAGAVAEILFDSLHVKPLPEKQVLYTPCTAEAIAPTRLRGIVFDPCATTTMRRRAKDRRVERQRHRHGDRYIVRDGEGQIRRDGETETETAETERRSDRVCERERVM